MIQLTITRASLSLADLVVTGEPPAPGATGAWLEEAGRPDITWRYTRAPESSDLHGAGTLLAAVKEHSSLPFTLYLQGADAASLAALEDEWADALEQWSYNAQLLVNGQGGTWSCDPTSPNWGDADSGMAQAHLSRAAVVIPVYPIPGA